MENSKKGCPVTAPSHYLAGSQFEVINVIEAWGFDKDYLLGNVIKYVARSGRKDPAKTVEDLKKAIWYLQRKIQNLEKSRE